MRAANKVHSDRERLAKELAQAIPDRDWLMLQLDGRVDEWRDPETHDAALDEIRRIFAIAGSPGAVVHRASPARTPAGLAIRAAAESELLADIASEDPEVLSFRATHLGSTVIGSTEALAFLRSPETSGMPASGAHAVEMEYLADVGLLALRVKADSALGELQRLSLRLAKQYPWEPAAAAAFVIEGAVPLVRPLSASTRFSMGGPAPPLARITLDVEPWVPASAVAAFYTQLRRAMLDSRGRPVSEGSAELVWFVLSQRRATPGVTWRELLDRWSNEHPDNRDRDSRHFHQSYERARRSLLYPGYHHYSRKD